MSEKTEAYGSRQLRRAAERQRIKELRKASQETLAAPSATAPPLRAEINRANSQHSTGPKTPEGKAASSGNSFKHGLYSTQLVIPGEDPAELDALKADLRAEHQPATAHCPINNPWLRSKHLAKHQLCPRSTAN